MKIFVAKLNYSTQERTVRSLFENFGTVSSCKIIIDRDTNRSKGFGFVEMDDSNEANAAINALNGFELDERQIVVKEAEERQSKPSDGYSRPRYSGGGKSQDRRSGGYDKRSGGYDKRGDHDD